MKLIFITILSLGLMSCAQRLEVKGLQTNDDPESSGGSGGDTCTGLQDLRPYAGGTGSALDPFLICNHEQFNEIGANSGDWGHSFILESSIDLSTYDISTYNIIGGDDCGASSFTGSLNGNGHTIRNLSLTKIGNNAGVFGCFNGNLQDINFENISIAGEEDIGVIAWLGSLDGTTISEIQNIQLTNINTTGSFKVGSLAGSGREARISNLEIINSDISNATGWGSDAAFGVGYCEQDIEISDITISNSTASHVDYVGGVYGQASTDCLANNIHITTTSIEGANEIGGIFGVAGGGRATNGYFSGTVNATTSNAGGLFGRSWWCGGVTFSNVLIEGSVISESFVGGAIGHLDDWVQCNMDKIESSATVTSNNGHAGGLIGRIGTESNVTNSAALGATNGSISGGLVGLFDAGLIENSYADGLVSGASRGGFSGEFNGGVCTNCYYTESTGEVATDDPDSTYILNADKSDSATFVGWDFATTWEIRGGRPRIQID